MKKYKIEERETIVINKLFIGKYQTINNLGHEIINLYQSDDGNDYWYLQPYGTFNKKWKGRVKYVVNVRPISGYEMEIVSVGEVEAELYDPYTAQQPDLIDVEYGGVPIKDLFSDNKWDPSKKQACLVTYKMRHTKKPVKQLVIKFSNSTEEKSDCVRLSYSANIPGFTTTKLYYSNDSHNDNFNVLNELICDNRNWIEKSSSSLKEIDFSHGNYEDSLIEIFGIGDLELPYSNAIAYYLRKYPSLISVLFPNVAKPENADIYREYRNIDILLETSDEYIIIENKIHSGINGIKLDDAGNDKSQLDKYVEILQQQKTGKKIIACILLPDYSTIDVDAYNHSCVQYRKVYYSELYNSLKSTEAYSLGRDSNFIIFVNSLLKHTYKTNDFYARMKKVLFQRIQAYQK